MTIYPSLLVPWSASPSPAEEAYRAAGLVKTKGTVYILPPPDAVLVTTFNAPPRAKTRMSSGAVALCKHFERGGASSERGIHHPFWTLPTGSNESKTNIAREVLNDMLRDARWRNVMLLHPGVAVYEIRNRLGYGMRWTLELEPRESQGDDSGRPSGLNRSVTSRDESVQPAQDPTVTSRNIARTMFRGFLEPIEGLDDVLKQNE